MIRLLDIVFGEQSAQIFAWLKRDMATATVPLTFDRGRDERRNRGEIVAAERREGDRRRHGVGEDFSRFGWARVQIE